MTACRLLYSFIVVYYSMIDLRHRENVVLVSVRQISDGYTDGHIPEGTTSIALIDIFSGC